MAPWVMCVVALTFAAPRRERPGPRAKQRNEHRAPKRATPATPDDLDRLDPDALLAAARRAYEELEYPTVVPYARAILARDEVDIEIQLDASLLLGSALAIIGDPIEAEKAFRLLLRGRPDFDLPPTTPPKIVAVFRKVETEERRVREQMAELRRLRIVEQLELTEHPPDELRGGLPIQLRYRLRDPFGAVTSMSVFYRKAGEPDFSSLALKVDDGGTWRGEIPGEWTENQAGLEVDYYLMTQDGAGRTLLTRGDATNPLALTLAPGSLADARPLHARPWFWIIAGTAAVAAGVSGWLIYRAATDLPDADRRVNF